MTHSAMMEARDMNRPTLTTADIKLGAETCPRCNSSLVEGTLQQPQLLRVRDRLCHASGRSSTRVETSSGRLSRGKVGGEFWIETATPVPRIGHCSRGTPEALVYVLSARSFRLWDEVSGAC